MRSFLSLHYFISADGNMFEIMAKDKPVLIEAFHINMDAKTDNVAVYYRPGHVDYRYDESYQLIYEATNVVGRGKGLATALPPFIPPILITPGTSYTFYVTVTTTGGGNLWYSWDEGSSSGTVMASDDNINIIEGMASGYPWSGYALNRRWNGLVHYSLQLTSPPTASPTISLSTFSPTNHPTPKPTSRPTKSPVVAKTPYPTDSIPSPQTGSPSGVIDDAAVVDAPTPASTQVPIDPTTEPTLSPTEEGTFPPTKAVTSLLPDLVPPSSASMKFNNYMGRICSYLFPLLIIAIFFL